MARGQFGREVARPRNSQPGDRVRAKNDSSAEHTRLPRYVRGHVGVVERDHGFHVFPDAAMGQRKSAMALHRHVRRRRTVGPDADPTVKISIDAFEPYLEPA